MHSASTLNSTSIVSSEQQQLSTRQNIQECNYNTGNQDITTEIQIDHRSQKSNNLSDSVIHTKIKNGVSNNSNKPTKIDINGNLFNNELNAKYSSSMRWKDVKTGLVRDRSNTYLKPAETNIQSTCCSPKLSRREKNSTSWLKYSKTSVIEEKENKMAGCDIALDKIKSSHKEIKQKENKPVCKISSTSPRLNNENVKLVQSEDNGTSQFKTSTVEELENRKEAKIGCSLDSTATDGRIQEAGLVQNPTNEEVSMDSSHLFKPEADQNCPAKQEFGKDQVESYNLSSSKEQTHILSVKPCADKNLDYNVLEIKHQHDETQSDVGQNQLPAYPVIVDFEKKQVPQLRDHNLQPLLDAAPKQDHNPQPVLDVAHRQDTVSQSILEAAKTLLPETVKTQDYISQPKLEVAQRQDSISEPILVAVQEEGAENLAPWRRQETRSNTKSPILNLITVSVTPGIGREHVRTEEIWCMEQRKHIHQTEYVGHSEQIEDHAVGKKEELKLNKNLGPTLEQSQNGTNGTSCVTLKSSHSTTTRVTEAAARVKEAAGAVRSVAENLLRAISPVLTENARQDTRIKPTLDLQNIKEVIAGQRLLTLPLNEEPEEPDRNIRKFARSRIPAPAPVSEDEDEEDSLGYEDDFSIGLDLPNATDVTSGNVTPIPTTGELEELSSIEEPTVIEDLVLAPHPALGQQQARDQVVQSSSVQANHPSTARSTPLKSLLKKPSVDIDDTDSESDEGNVSPKKVHFSEIDQIKLMSQESLASMAASECPEMFPVTLCKTIMTTTQVPSVVRLVASSPAALRQQESSTDTLRMSSTNQK